MKSLGGATERLRQSMASWLDPLRNRPSPDSRSHATTVFCFGQSNAVCLVRAWKRGLYRPDDQALDFKFLLWGPRKFPADSMVVPSPSSGADVIHPLLAHAFEEHGVLSGSTDAWLVSVVRGNAYNVYGLFEPNPPFDFVHPDMPALALRAGAQLLPYDAVRTMFSQAAESTRRFYKCLPRQNIAGVLHLEAPPPIPSEKQCQRSVEGVLLPRALGLPRGVQISPREFRMKLWRCQSDVNREICVQNDVIYVPPPEEALDEGGFLLPAAWWGATHASSWYGALALRKIEGVITERRRRQ